MTDSNLSSQLDDEKAHDGEATMSAGAVPLPGHDFGGGAGESVEAWTVDLSLVGVRLASMRTFPTEQPIAITFHLRAVDQRAIAERVDGLIVRKQAEGEGSVFRVDLFEPLNSSHNSLLLRRLANS